MTSCNAPTFDLTIPRGKTFEFALLYADTQLIYKPIAAMVSQMPVRLQVLDHGIPEDWPVEVVGASSPQELNTHGEPRNIRVVDKDTIEINTLRTTSPLRGSAHVMYPEPIDLTGWSARAWVCERVGGAVLFRWDSDATTAPDGLIGIDVARSSFVLNIDAVTAANMPFSRGMWEMEATAPDGKVYAVIAISKIAVSSELVK